MSLKIVCIFAMVLAIIVFFGILLFIKPAHVNTNANTSVNTRAITNAPTVNPTLNVNNPPMTNPLPTYQTQTPTTQTPTYPSTTQAQTQAIINRPFKIQSVATGLYYSDKGMTPKIADAIIFTESPTHNLMTDKSEWTIKYAELNGRAILTNDSGTAGYIINTPQKTSGGPALASSPFIGIPSVAVALLPANAETFEVVKVF